MGSKFTGFRTFQGPYSRRAYRRFHDKRRGWHRVYFDSDGRVVHNAIDCDHEHQGVALKVVDLHDKLDEIAAFNNSYEYNRARLQRREDWLVFLWLVLVMAAVVAERYSHRVAVNFIFIFCVSAILGFINHRRIHNLDRTHTICRDFTQTRKLTQSEVTKEYT